MHSIALATPVAVSMMQNLWSLEGMVRVQSRRMVNAICGDLPLLAYRLPIANEVEPIASADVTRLHKAKLA